MEEYDTVFFFPFTGEQTREAKDDKKQQFSYILGVPYRPILPFLCSNNFFLSKKVMQIYFAAKMCSVVVIFDSFSRFFSDNLFNF